MTLPYALRKAGKIRKFIRTIHNLAEAGKNTNNAVEENRCNRRYYKNNRIRIIKDKTGFV